MVIQEEDDREVIYQTEDKGSLPHLPLAPPPQMAPPLGFPPFSNKFGTVGRLKASQHELAAGTGSFWNVKIFEPVHPHTLIDGPLEVPGTHRVFIRNTDGDDDPDLVDGGPQ